MIQQQFITENSINSLQEAFAYISQKPDLYTTFSAKIASKILLENEKNDESIGRFIGKIEKKIKLIQSIQIIPIDPENKGEAAIKKMLLSVSLIRKLQKSTTAPYK